MSTDPSGKLLADFLAWAPTVPKPSAAEVADKIRHDLAMASSDADKYAQAVMVMLRAAKPSAYIALGTSAINDLARLLVPLVGSLEFARVQIELLEAQGVTL